MPAERIKRFIVTKGYDEDDPDDAPPLRYFWFKRLEVLADRLRVSVPEAEALIRLAPEWARWALEVEEGERLAREIDHETIL
ncbi:MAG: hypothetical protein HC884_13365 [Chloroflexaceae bacterium]|nr:hypothetical protein [Chloroflexaceae bacterium]